MLGFTQTYLFFSSLCSDGTFWVLGPATGAFIDDVAEDIVQLITVTDSQLRDRISQRVAASFCEDRIEFVRRGVTEGKKEKEKNVHR